MAQEPGIPATEPKNPVWRKLLFTRATSITLGILSVVLIIVAMVAPFVARHWAHRHLVEHGIMFEGWIDGPEWIQPFGNWYPESLWKREQAFCFALEPCSFASIRYFPEVKHIVLNDVTWFGDNDCIHLTTLPKLQCLEMLGTDVSDVGVAHLSRCESLERCYLDNTRITDASIPSLARLHRLESLDVAGTQITAAGVRSLSASLPGCEIYSDHLIDESVELSPPD